MPIPGIYSPAQGIAVPLVSPMTITVVTSASSVVAALTAPAGIQANDLLVIWDVAANNIGAASIVTPNGYTQILNAAGGGNNSAAGVASYKIAAGTESGVGTGGMNGGVFNNKSMFVFRGSRPITGVTALGVLSNALDSGDPAAINVLSGVGSPTLIVFGCYGSKNGTLASRTFSPAADQTITASAATAFSEKVYTAAPANVAIDMASPGNGTLLAGFYLQLTG